MNSALLATAEVEANKLRAAAKAEIEAERRTEALAAEDRAGRLAVDIAGKLLDRLPREARVTAFIDGIAAGLAELPEGTRASVGADGTFATNTPGRVRPRGLTISASSTLGRHQIIVYASGTVQLPAGTSAQSGCFGTVWVQIKAGTRTLAYTPLPLSASCRYRESRNFAYSRVHHSSHLHVAAHFAGNGTLQPIWSRSTSVRA